MRPGKIRWARSSRVSVGRGALGVLLWGASFMAGCEKTLPPPPPPPTVEVAAVVRKDVPIYQEWVGDLDGSVNAVIKPQVTGYLTKQNYREGDLVKAGQPLFEIDPRTFKAAVDQKQGSLDEAKANLARCEATYTTARADLARIKPLAAKNAVSQKDLDDAVGKDLAAKASVESAKAAIATATANLETARLDLNFTKITSPVTGIAGIAKTQLGNLVSAGMQSELTTVSTVDPIKVYINVSEQEYLKIRMSGEKVEQMTLELILADGSLYPFKGKFALADRQVDINTGTLRVGTLFPNKNNFLRPGQYGRIKAHMTTKNGALLVPERAVTEVQGKYMVAVVGSDNKVEIRQVKAGERVGGEWLIDSGLKPGEQVVAEGTQKVHAGSLVNPKPFNPAAPTPTDAPAPPAAGKKG
jgi:membrane fusion protein, multidrug efflux system